MSDIIGKNEPLVKIACNYCLHYHRANMAGFSCDAFKAIPREILTGKNDHSKPLPEQNNKIVYEPKKK